MNENIDLTKILENCPVGWEFWSDSYGKVRFNCINKSYDRPIFVKRTDGGDAYYTKEGWCSKDFSASCLLWPSKDCRDWSKFTAPCYKKEKFNPKTLKPFDKVLVQCNNSESWKVQLFSHIIEGDKICPYVCISYNYKYCIPYNNDTKHLVGTKKEAPEFYRYWEN